MESEPPIGSPTRQGRSKSPRKPSKEPAKAAAKPPERTEKVYFKSLENADTFKQHLKAKHARLQAQVSQIQQSQFDSSIVPKNIAQLSRRPKPGKPGREDGVDVFARDAANTGGRRTATQSLDAAVDSVLRDSDTVSAKAREGASA